MTAVSDDDGGPSRFDASRPDAWRSLIVLAVVQLSVYLLISRLSVQFDDAVAGHERPLPQVLGLFGLAFLCYLCSCAIAFSRCSSIQTLMVVTVSAVLFRVVMLPSTPIQEVDIYRYLWDGQVSVVGVDPYMHPPQDVIEQVDGVAGRPIQKLVDLVQRDAVAEEILWRVHFRELRTIYPPVSQVVFSCVTSLTPRGSSLQSRLIWMKAFICVFDLGTMVVVILLLRLAGMPESWAIAYAWCPLLMKEFANSGHLDSIAVMLTSVSVYAISVAVFSQGSPTGARSSRNSKHLAWVTAAAVFLALAVGAKLYPVVLFPLVVYVLAKRLGWLATTLFFIMFSFVVGVVMQPMLSQSSWNAEHRHVTDETIVQSDGLDAFLRSWEMNDFLFLILIENLKPDQQVEEQNRAWFCVVPDRYRAEVVNRVSSALGMESWDVPFAIARMITGLMFVASMIIIVLLVRPSASVSSWLSGVFLTLAWFWLLCPTKNPWYWSWALPFIAFARCRSWLLVSGLLFVYYLRFWLIFHYGRTPVAGTSYVGAVYFDLVLTWLEFGPWFLLLGLETVWRRVVNRSESA